ncbi:MAG TPA: molybdate ABC transporter substrate-binding protein, partial [Acidimicrobiia bacterium]|nr:molybdate ABC transporter substrate-binding protein [Acidimicrobiia bacterium]
MTSRWVRIAIVLVLIGGAAACGSSSKPSGTPATPLTGDLNVFAAASLTSAFTQVGEDLEAANEGLTIENNFAGSQALVTQIEEGAPADVFASADEKNMQKVVDEGLASDPELFATNTLVLAVPAGNPGE